MKILSIHVQTFGKLNDVKLDLHDGVNAIQNVNGYGKTTLASFIRAMLYGFTYKTVGGVKDSARFAPWQGSGRFGGSMVVLHEGVTYRIERFFGATPRQETLAVTNDKTGKPVDLNTLQPGEFFLGLTADSYDRSAYFPQEAVELSSNDNFDSRLANLIENGAEDFDDVVKKLTARKKTFRLDRGNGGKIYDLQCKERELLQRQSDGQRAERRAAEIDRTLAQIEIEQQSLREQLSREIEKVKQQPPQQQPLQPQPQQVQPQRSSGTLLYFGITLALLGIVFFVLGIAQTLGVVAYAVGASMLALGIGSVIVRFVLAQRAKPQPTERQIEQQHVEQPTEQEKAPEKSNEHDIVERLNALAMQVGQLTAERKSLAFDSVAVQDELLAVAEQKQQAEFECKVCETVIGLLYEAKDNLSSSYLPRLTARCSELLSEITQSDLAVVVDRNFNVKIRQQGQTRDMSEFSRGIREITLLCFRVALSELLYDGAIPFIIIDDAFVNFDEYNFVRATDLLRQIAKHAQVVYFTCHNRTGKLLQ